MLGFGSLGEFALGEGGDLTSKFVTSGFSQPVRRVTLTAAVVATTVAGFVPPRVGAAPVFSSFSQPQPARRVMPTPVEQPVGLFEFTPSDVAFSGFMEFGQPRFVRYNFADQQTSTLFEVVFVPPLQGGGTSRKLPDPAQVGEPPRRKQKTGLEPVKKLPPRKVETVERAIPLPPSSFIRPPAAVKQVAPLELGDRDMIPADLLGLQAQIHAAEDATDLQDILDIIAFLESSGL